MHNMFNERSDADGGDSFLLRVFDSTVTRREVLSYGMGAARVELKRGWIWTCGDPGRQSRPMIHTSTETPIRDLNLN